MKKRYLALLLGWVLSGCVEPYDGKYGNELNLLVVDGYLTNAPERQSITLRMSDWARTPDRTGLVTGAHLQLTINDGETLPFTETTKGVYSLPESFRGKPGDQYKLSIVLADGKKYASTTEKMPSAVPITRVYQEFDPKGIRQSEISFLPAHHLFVDVNDPVTERNFYLWKWTLWERQYACATCTNALYQTSVQDCVSMNINYVPPIIYDYACEGDCWEIFHEEELNVFADIYSNGKTITGKKVATLPFFSWDPALVELRQLSLSTDAYRYFSLIDQQSQRTGSLTDTPPAALAGNIKNVDNPNEYVMGYFSAAAVTIQKYWLQRKDATFAKPIGLLGGRDMQLEPYHEEPPGVARPPRAPCKLSATRTPLRPDGWQ
ncbi:DUF4249 domain-containing protein [Siphonobacter aquaeclarae]|uniref:DUF4249 domain-containing protein n=1 Tax=Siphonobacter aquaeclarae TaxID=563176 RepID=A0A1G9Q9D4_9BACT|nr:DUF4249 domain-containing protein [Siphonobacter aquaeclarae]SDM06945.1 protein of unknown function [Siphonobacter aquaeclarae]